MAGRKGGREGGKEGKKGRREGGRGMWNNLKQETKKELPNHVGGANSALKHVRASRAVSQFLSDALFLAMASGGTTLRLLLGPAQLFLSQF